jgi:1,4-alpha-glucan branching enzyme
MAVVDEEEVPKLTNVRPASRTGMGSIPFESGVAFRVWTPNAEAVHVSGDFNDRSDTRTPLAAEGNGYWSGEVSEARPGDKYEYVITYQGQRLRRNDPYGRDVESSVGRTVIVDPAAFAWDDDSTFHMPAWNDLVIYEMHIGTFNDLAGAEPGTLDTAIQRLSHLAELGVNAVQVMPLAEFPGDYSWGYNPSDIFAVESYYGGSAGLKAFVKAAHRLGLAVIIDVVYNHLGPNDIDTWQFDGWHEPDKGGIYFYNDWRSHTPWTTTGDLTMGGARFVNICAITPCTGSMRSTPTGCDGT